MKVRHYAKADTQYGELIHYVPVEYRNRTVSIRGMHTLCGRLAYSSLEGCGDEVDCKHCLKAHTRQR